MTRGTRGSVHVCCGGSGDVTDFFPVYIDERYVELVVLCVSVVCVCGCVYVECMLCTRLRRKSSAKVFPMTPGSLGSPNMVWVLPTLYTRARVGVCMCVRV